MKRPPLLSDDDCEAMADMCGNAYFVAEDIRNKYEEARAKDAELIRLALIAVRYAPARVEVLNFLSAAKAAGFTPLNL